MLTDHHLRRRMRRWRQDEGVRWRRREAAGGVGERRVGGGLSGCVYLYFEVFSRWGWQFLTDHCLGSCDTRCIGTDKHRNLYSNMQIQTQINVALSQDIQKKKIQFSFGPNKHLVSSFPCCFYKMACRKKQ